MKKIRIGSRGSKLALIQAATVRDRLVEIDPSLERACEIVPIHTTGDKIQAVASNLTNKAGLFVKEIERALKKQKIDIAVHSLKDLPAKQHSDFDLGAFLARQDPRDAIVCSDRRRVDSIWHMLQTGAAAGVRFGTSSPRRSAMLRHYLRDCHIQPLRGNVDSRLKRLQTDDFDVIVLAMAGLLRLGLQSEAVRALPLQRFIPAAGQGVVVVELLKQQQQLLTLVEQINHPPTQTAALAERSFIAKLGASCWSAVGVYAELEGDTIRLHAALFSSDGREKIEDQLEGRLDEPEELGCGLAERFIAQGAASLMGDG